MEHFLLIRACRRRYRSLVESVVPISSLRKLVFSISLNDQTKISIEVYLLTNFCLQGSLIYDWEGEDNWRFIFLFSIPGGLGQIDHSIDRIDHQYDRQIHSTLAILYRTYACDFDFQKIFVHLQICD